MKDIKFEKKPLIDTKMIQGESEEFRNLIVFLQTYYALIDTKGPRRKYRTTIDNNINFIVEKVLYSTTHPRSTLRKIGLIFYPNCIAINVHYLCSLMSVSKSWFTREMNKENWAKEPPNSSDRQQLNILLGKAEAHKFTIRYPPETSLVSSISIDHKDLLTKQFTQEPEYPSSPVYTSI